MRATRFSTLADTVLFNVVYPDGTKMQNTDLSGFQPTVAGLAMKFNSALSYAWKIADGTADWLVRHYSRPHHSWQRS